jgi:hypothetical protein
MSSKCLRACQILFTGQIDSLEHSEIRKLLKIVGDRLSATRHFEECDLSDQYGRLDTLTFILWL